ncbi:MAG: hypothetical protein SGILL_005576 [Bacillariaceae sp.]
MPIEEVDIVAFDFPGHGQSSHKSKDADGQVVDYCFYVAEAVRILGWVVVDEDDYDARNVKSAQRFILMGHSMGGAVSTMYAASFPQQISALITLDAFGPDFESPKNISARIRRHILDRYQHNVQRNGNDSSGGSMRVAVPMKKRYQNVQAAATARMRTARLAPGGHQYLSQEAAMRLVQRATVPIDSITTTTTSSSSSNSSSSSSSNNAPKVHFIHDPRLKYSPVLLHTRDQVEGFWKAIQCPVLFLVAEDGWPFPSALMEQCQAWVRHKGNLTFKKLHGSHHFHADPDTADAVAKTAVEFIQQEQEFL